MNLGLTMMLKSMGIDMEEIQTYGRQAGEVVTDFRTRLERIESDLKRLIQLMEKDNERRDASGTGEIPGEKIIAADEPGETETVRILPASWP